MNRSLAPTCPEMMSLILVNKGDGFGLGISDKTSINEVPIIDAIKPRSPAHNEGILKVGDRIVSINGIQTSQLTPIRFSKLKNEALAAPEIDLDLEIDVCDAKILFGTFDVTLEGKLRIGFIFHEMKEKSPMVLKGILKGSAAHRSGQVFPGDEITFIEFKKNEVYDPLAGKLIKEKTVNITVHRDLKKILGLDRKDTSVPDIRVPNPSLCPSDPFSCNSNPRFREETVVPRSRENYGSDSEDTKSLIIPDTRIINPSPCFTDETSYLSLPHFQQKQCMLGHAVLRLDREEKPECVRDIGITNGSLCSMDSSSRYSNPKFEKKLKKKNHSLSKNPVAVEDDRKETIILRTADIKAPNPSVCSSYSSSNYANSCYEQELKKKIRSSSKNSLFSEYELSSIHREDTPVLITPDIKAPYPSPCPTDLSSSYSHSRCEQELRKIIRSSNKNSLISDHKVLVNQCEDAEFLSTPIIKSSNPSLYSTYSSSNYANSCYEQELKKKIRSSSKNSLFSEHELLAIHREDTPVLITPDIKAPHPSPCPTDLSSNYSHSRCEQELRKIIRSSNKNTLISDHAVLVNQCEDAHFLSTPDIKAPSPSLCSTDSSSCYSNPHFQQEKSRNSYEELLKQKLRPSRKNSVVVDHGHEVTPASSFLDIRSPNPSLCSTDSSSRYSNPRFQQEKSRNSYEELLKQKLRPSRKNSVIVDHGHEVTPASSFLDIRAPNPSPCSTDSSSRHSNPSFQQEKSRNSYEELLKQKLRPSRKNSVIVDHGHEVTPASSILDIRAPNPSLCSADESSYYSNPYSQRTESIPESEEIFVKRNTTIQSFRKNSAVIDHEVTIYRKSTSIDFGIQFVQNEVTGDWYVKDIRPHGPAHKSGVIKKFDRIIEVNGVLVHRFTDISLLESFSQSDQAGHKMDLVIRKVYREEPNEVQAKNKGTVK